MGFCSDPIVDTTLGANFTLDVQNMTPLEPTI